MTVREQLRIWGIGLAVFVVLLWMLADALLPFVLGAAIAYLTDPWADWLERLGLSRILATIVITVCSIGAVAFGVLLVVPLVIDQVQQVVDGMPAYIDEGRALLARWLPEAQDEESFLNHALANLRENARSWSVDVLQKVGSFGVAVVSVAAVLLVTPVVAFYLLMDWDRMVEGVDELCRVSIATRSARSWRIWIGCLPGSCAGS